MVYVNNLDIRQSRQSSFSSSSFELIVVSFMQEDIQGPNTISKFFYEVHSQNILTKMLLFESVLLKVFI